MFSGLPDQSYHPLKSAGLYQDSVFTRTQFCPLVAASAGMTPPTPPHDNQAEFYIPMKNISFGIPQIYGWFDWELHVSPWATRSNLSLRLLSVQVIVSVLIVAKKSSVFLFFSHLCSSIWKHERYSHSVSVSCSFFGPSSPSLPLPPFLTSSQKKDETNFSVSTGEKLLLIIPRFLRRASFFPGP